MNKDARPFVDKAYSVAFKYRKEIRKRNLDKLEKTGIIEKVEYGD